MIKYFVFRLGSTEINEFCSSEEATTFLQSVSWTPEETVVIAGFRRN